MPEAVLNKLFEDADCSGFLHVVDLSSNREIALRADEPVVMASVFKAIVALEFYEQVRQGKLDGAMPVLIEPGTATPGPTGLSNFRHPSQMARSDLADLMMTISDNAATDVLTRTVGIESINRRAIQGGCKSTIVVSDLQDMLDTVGREMGFVSYAELLEGQSGRLGAAAKAASTDGDKILRVSALNPKTGTRTTARDMTTFLASVWSDKAASPEACGDLRYVMTRQVTRRLEAAVPAGGSLAAKSGGLFGRVRNEIGVIGYPDGKAYAASVFTFAHKPFVGTAQINSAMANAVDQAIRQLRA